MTIKKYILYLFLSFVFVGTSSAQQDQMYTQYMFNKMGINPAYAGNEKYLGFTGVIRDQWNGFPGAPKAQLLSVNLPRIGEKIGLGFNLRSQSIGISKSITYSGIYSYKFLFGDAGTLSMGLEFSGRNLVMNFGDKRLVATQGLENDNSIPKNNVTKNLVNLGYGIYFNSDQFYFGASIPRMIKSDLDFDNNNIISEEVRHIYFMGGGAFPIDRDLSMTAQTLVKLAENSPFDIDLSLSITANEKYTAGLSYRFGGGTGDIGESIDVLFGFQVSDQFMIGFAHDFTTSKLRSYDNGSLELVAHYAMGKKKNRVVVVNPRYF